MFSTNSEWVKENSILLENLKDNPDMVFQLVTQIHPNSGMAFRRMPKITGAESINKIATYADAVTLVCYENIGNLQQYKAGKEMIIDGVNETGIGGIAYIALNHPSFEIRENFRGWYEKIMAQKRKQSTGVCVLQ